MSSPLLTAFRDSGKGCRAPPPLLPTPHVGHGACCSLCSFCVFSVCYFLSGGVGRWEWGGGCGGPKLGSQRRQRADLLLASAILASPQTMTVGTTVTRPAAATPAPARSSSVTAGAASPSTGPATGTMTAGTTAMRPTPTAPTRVRAWGPAGAA